jgi:peptide methionine sulfoxide reductase MsrA
VKRVETGFRGFREVDTVVYDPAVISVRDMVDALVRAGTYRGTAP